MKQLSKRQIWRIEKWKFLRVTDLMDWPRNGKIGGHLYADDLGTYATIKLGGARDTEDMIGCAGPATALMIITPQGEVIIGQAPVMEYQQKAWQRFLAEFAPNGQNSRREMSTVTLDIGDVFDRIHSWDANPVHYIKVGKSLSPEMFIDDPRFEESDIASRY